MQLPHKMIRDRAYFIAGRPAASRKSHDPNIESAIRDVEYYLDSLPDNFYRPLISGATAASQEQILVLTWLVQMHDEMKAVEVAFLGNGMCRVMWPSASLTREVERLSVKDLLSLHLEEMVSQYRAARDPDEWLVQ